MAASGPEIRINKFNHNVTLTVKISTEFMVRKWIALKLIWLATYILGCRLEVENVQTSNTHR